MYLLILLFPWASIIWWNGWLTMLQIIISRVYENVYTSIHIMPKGWHLSTFVIKSNIRVQMTLKELLGCFSNCIITIYKIVCGSWFNANKMTNDFLVTCRLVGYLVLLLFKRCLKAKMPWHPRKWLCPSDYRRLRELLNWCKGKPSGSIACTRKQQPRFYWSCSSVS